MSYLSPRQSLTFFYLILKSNEAPEIFDYTNNHLEAHKNANLKNFPIGDSNPGLLGESELS